MLKTLAVGFAAMALVASLAAQSGTPAADRSASNPTVTTEQFEQWKKELSNWGRWGKDDQIGALNLITPAKRQQAAAKVKEGF